MTRSEEPVVLIDALDDIRIVTLNRPEVLNAVNADLHARLAEIWTELAADEAAKAVVLIGAGRAFSAGGDVAHLQAHSSDAALRERSIRYDRRLQTEMLHFPLPVVAAVNGPAVGLGCSLALGCDIVFMAESAYIADPHVSVGLVAGDGGVTFWPLLTSLLLAKEYLFTGEKIDAQTAVRLGLANRVVADEDLRDQAIAFARRLAAQPSQALRSTKAALNLVLEQVARSGTEAALIAERETMASPDFARITTRMAGRREQGSGS